MFEKYLQYIIRDFQKCVNYNLYCIQFTRCKNFRKFNEIAISFFFSNALLFAIKWFRVKLQKEIFPILSYNFDI